jgi:hypothetical protein
MIIDLTESVLDIPALALPALRFTNARPHPPISFPQRRTGKQAGSTITSIRIITFTTYCINTKLPWLSTHFFKNNKKRKLGQPAKVSAFLLWTLRRLFTSQHPALSEAFLQLHAWNGRR